MTPNKHRGDVPVTLVVAGVPKQFILRPSFQALSDCEEETGLELPALFQAVLTLRLGIRRTAAVLAAGLRGSGEPATIETVGDMLAATGLSEVQASVAKFLLSGLTAGQKLGEADAAKLGVWDTRFAASSVQPAAS